MEIAKQCLIGCDLCVIVHGGPINSIQLKEYLLFLLLNCAYWEQESGELSSGEREM